MMEKITGFTDYFRKIPAAFLVAIVSVLGLILFLPESYAKIVAVDGFREQYRVYLGPVFLLALSFSIARIYMFILQGHRQRKALKAQQEKLHMLTPEEKECLAQFIFGQQNSIYVGMGDGVMGGLSRSKNITCLVAKKGGSLAYNLEPWAREYLENNQDILEGYAGK